MYLSTNIPIRLDMALALAMAFALALSTGTALAAQAHDDTPMQPAAVSTNDSPATLLPLVARYRVTLTEPSATEGHQTRQQEWTFVRGVNRIALSKGNIDEIWQRQPNGSISLQRVFHDLQRVIDYPAGELTTLGIQVDWTALSSFTDPRDRAQTEWKAALQLPTRMTRALPRGARVVYELIDCKPELSAVGSRPAVSSAEYLHIDAADFGDMAYDPAVRRAEALDVRAGWRSVHEH